MDCDVCPIISRGIIGNPKAKIAKYAVKEKGVLLLLCEGCMDFLYGMHETVLLPADTYVPEEDESDIAEIMGRRQ